MTTASRELRLIAWLLGLVWAAGCAPLTPTDPAPTEVREPVPAALALADTARALEEAGEYASAAASLERALRLEPQNAELWHRLAALRLAQGDWEAAESLAFRSLGLTEAQEVARANWRVIADARRGTGDEEGVREAEARLAEGE